MLTTSNTTTVAVLANTPVPLGEILRRSGGDVCYKGGTAIIERASGYYLVSANATFAPTAAGPVSMIITENGSSISGAETTQTVAASGDATALMLSAIPSRVTCCCGKNIGVMFSVPGNLENILVTVEKL